MTTATAPMRTTSSSPPSAWNETLPTCSTSTTCQTSSHSTSPTYDPAMLPSMRFPASSETTESQVMTSASTASMSSSRRTPPPTTETSPAAAYSSVSWPSTMASRTDARSPTCLPTTGPAKRSPWTSPASTGQAVTSPTESSMPLPALRQTD